MCTSLASNVRACRALGRASARRASIPCCPALADIITTVTENAYYGRCVSTSATAGVAIVKTNFTIVVGTFTEPVMAAQAIPAVHKIADDLRQSGS